jgi:hypothetical protein
MVNRRPGSMVRGAGPAAGGAPRRTWEAARAASSVRGAGNGATGRLCGRVIVRVKTGMVGVHAGT